MKTYFNHTDSRFLVFDIDMTLYYHPEFYEYQQMVQLQEVASRLSKPQELLVNQVRTYQKTNKKSLGNSLKEMFDISIEQSVQMRSQLIEPERYLREDKRLIQTLNELIKYYEMAALTNNPTDIGRRILQALGVSDFFPQLVGLNSTNKSKPHPLPFETVIELTGFKPEQTISIGDRYHVDLEYPMTHNWAGAILLENRDDIYNLVNLLTGDANEN
ncbi:HAD family hydrolase [Spirochaeta cellobiosiphila]|uniref:HAD family hydrolase n=1 Tax=Spirochaeta cellobiosiphila TaxID=504483 RepID=UPI000427F6BF|nr:HAD family hydrolase [Spirochaeta cellobiosiphila]